MAATRPSFRMAILMKADGMREASTHIFRQIRNPALSPSLLTPSSLVPTPQRKPRPKRSGPTARDGCCHSGQIARPRMAGVAARTAPGGVAAARPLPADGYPEAGPIGQDATPLAEVNYAGHLRQADGIREGRLPAHQYFLCG